MSRPLSTAVCAAALLTLAACSTTAAPAPQSPASAASGTGAPTHSPSTAAGTADTTNAATTTYPLTLENCGRTLTVEAAPQRVVALNQSTTETLLSLGVGDRVVGTSTWFDPVLPQLSAANSRIPRIADDNPSLESVLAKEPDFATATYRADLPGEGKTTMDDLAGLGISTYMAPAECALTKTSGDGRRTTPLTMDVLYQEPLELARIMGVPQKGTELVDSLKARMEKASTGRPGAGKTVAFWFANDESPYVAGGWGSTQLAADAVGLENVFAESHDEWPQVSWEAFAEKNPDVIVLGDLTRKRQTSETAASKIAFLEKNPVTAQMKAVKNKAYITLPGSDMNPSIRTVDAAEKLAAGLTHLGGNR